MSDDFYLSDAWRRRVEQSLGRDITDPRRRKAWIEWERQNLAQDIESAQRRGAAREAQGLRYYAWRLWQELTALDSTVAYQ
jgi:hypothetical protein